jgi:hypothetical protein
VRKNVPSSFTQTPLGSCFPENQHSRTDVA